MFDFFPSTLMKLLIRYALFGLFTFLGYLGYSQTPRLVVLRFDAARVENTQHEAFYRAELKYCGDTICSDSLIIKHIVSGNVVFRARLAPDQREKVYVGLCISFHNNGAVCDSAYYDNGVLSGEYVAYNQSGNLICRGLFANNHCVDTLSYYYGNGRVRKKIAYYPNGQVESVYCWDESGQELSYQEVKRKSGLPLLQSDPDVSITPLFSLAEMFRIESPRWINQPEIVSQIEYPRNLKRQGISGRVLVRILLDCEGNYIKHKILSSPHPGLTAAVEPLIPQMRFSPLRLADGLGITTWITAPFIFQITGGNAPTQN